MLSGLMNNSAATGAASGLVGGLAGSLLTSKTGRKIGKNALKLGGVAAVGAIAYGAYKKYASKQIDHGVTDHSVNETTFINSDFLPNNNDQESVHKLELTLVKAMLAASRADGEVELAETQIIFKQIRSFNLNEQEEVELIDQFNKPTNIEELIEAATTIELATEIYTVSCMVIDEPNASEKEYLCILASRLKLPGELVEAIENEVNKQSYNLAA